MQHATMPAVFTHSTPHPGPSRTDAELLQAVRGGDDPAFGELYQRYRSLAERIARRTGVSGVDVDDVVGEAWTKVLRALRSGRGPSTNFPGYLATATRRVSWTHSNSAARLAPTDDHALLDGVWLDELPDHLAETDLGRALVRLPPTWREVLWRVEIDGEKVAEIAARHGKSANSVSAIASRARRRLREELAAVEQSRVNSSESRKPAA